MHIHLDTDLGGDPDDVGALAMLLGWSGVEITGITTTLDREGVRAGYTAHTLRLAHRADIPIAVGSGASLTTGQTYDPFIGDARYWPEGIPPRPADTSEALDLLSRSIDAEATIVAVGGLTNLALLETEQPGRLLHARVVCMGGWIDPPMPGLPSWGPEMDWNIQVDSHAATIVFHATTDLTLATFGAALRAHLRAFELERLRASGPIGQLIASQTAAWAADQGFATLAAAHDGLPNDLVNIQWDPVACAVALGWPGVVVEEARVCPVWDGNILRFERDDDGRPVRLLTSVDGITFADAWMRAVERADKG